ncbi:hypothetical protein LAM01_08520 [Amylolactobacillus amylophilus]|nr:hypothetical protein LAM01_08520 [Amylolactobacillus amylophilus]
MAFCDRIYAAKKIVTAMRINSSNIAIPYNGLMINPIMEPTKESTRIVIVETINLESLMKDGSSIFLKKFFNLSHVLL